MDRVEFHTPDGWVQALVARPAYQCDDPVPDQPDSRVPAPGVLLLVGRGWVLDRIALACAQICASGFVVLAARTPAAPSEVAAWVAAVRRLDGVIPGPVVVMGPSTGIRRYVDEVYPSASHIYPGDLGGPDGPWADLPPLLDDESG